MTDHFSINTTAKVTAQAVADLITTALEGGSNYWLRCVELVRPHPPEGQDGPWYADASVYVGEFEILCTYDDPDGDEGVDYKTSRVGREAVATGLALFSQAYPRSFGRFLNEDYDANDADIFMQMLLLKEVIYS
jgi:hypothetical protein